jgi:hypothetical protein
MIDSHGALRYHCGLAVWHKIYAASGVALVMNQNAG